MESRKHFTASGDAFQQSMNEAKALIAAAPARKQAIIRCHL